MNLDLVYQSYSDLEEKWNLRDETRWWLGVTLENRRGFQGDLEELRRRCPRELRMVLEEKLALYDFKGRSEEMSDPERVLKEALGGGEIGISPLTKKQKEEAERKLLKEMEDVIMGEYSAFSAKGMEVQEAREVLDDKTMDFVDAGGMLLGLIKRYREKSDANQLINSLEKVVKERISRHETQ